MGCSIIQVVQDAAAIIRNDTPDSVQYLYTKGLQSCIAIMAKGTNGIALLHDGGKLTEGSIANVFREIGEIEFWTTAFYPRADNEYPNRAYHQQEYGEKGIYRTKFERISSIMARVLGSNIQSSYQGAQDGEYYRAEERGVCINRRGEVITQNLALFLRNHFYFPQPSIQLIQRVCELNHSLMLEGQTFDCHLQYDGNRFTEHPNLTSDIDEIEEFAKDDDVINGRLQAFKAAKDELEQVQRSLNSIRQEYPSNDGGIPSAENALRRAADNGNIKHIRFLIERAEVDVNSRGQESGKTALHRAAEKGHQKAVKMLLGYGASKEILDNNGNPPNC